MIKKAIFPAALALIMLFGLFFPDAVLRFFDEKNEKPVYTISCPADDYVYRGTFENRIGAFSAYENASVSVYRIEETEIESVSELPWTLSELIPELGAGEWQENEFYLSPVHMNARFAYRQYSGAFEGGTIRIVADAETGKPILISLTNAKNALSGWDKTERRNVESFSEAVGLDVYEVTQAYARLLGYHELNDLTNGNSYGGSVTTVKTDVKGEKMQLSVTFSEPAGILNYRLISKTGE